MNLQEVILERLKDFDATFTEHGLWTGEEYAAIVAPLHQALLILAQVQLNKEIQNE